MVVNKHNAAFAKNYRTGFMVGVPAESFPKVFQHYGKAFSHTQGYNTKQLRSEIRSWLATNQWHLGDRMYPVERLLGIAGQEIWFADEQVAVEFKLIWL